MSSKSVLQKESFGLTLSELRKLDPNEELTPEQAAAEVGRKRQTVYLWMRRERGGLKYRLDGPRLKKIRRGDLVAFLESGQHREEDDGFSRDDSNTRGLILMLLDVARAAARWRDAHSIYSAQKAALEHGEPTVTDLELAGRCFDDATTRHAELLNIVKRVSAGDLDEFRAVIESGDCRILLPKPIDNELNFTPMRKDDLLIHS